MRHTHPLCKEVRYSLFQWWLQKHGWNTDLAAATLGVSRRTSQRWVRKRDVPMHVAILLEQLRSGPIFKFGTFRGPSAVRAEWRAVFPEGWPVQLSLL